MDLSQVVGLPGTRVHTTASYRTVTSGGPLMAVLPRGRIIAGACSRDPGNTTDVTRLRAGIVMGKITSVVNSLGTVGFFAPAIYGVTTNAEPTGSTSIQATAAVVTELIRRRGTTGTFNLIGPGSAAGVVISETVTYSAASSTNITVTALTNSFIAGSFICPTDGSEDPLAFIPDGHPIRVTNQDGTSQDIEWPTVPVSMVVDSSQLLPAWPSDTSLQEWLVSRLNRAAGGKFVFDHTYNA